MKKKNLVMIGMPASGKSTAGLILAREMKYNFFDTDLLLQSEADQTLEEIIEERGIPGFLEFENGMLSELNISGCVISTGGSAVYGEEAMDHLKESGTVIYLKCRYEVIESRVGNIKTRGVVVRKGETLRDLYEERVPLYEKYADITVNCDGLTLEQTVQTIKRRIKEASAE